MVTVFDNKQEKMDNEFESQISQGRQEWPTRISDPVAVVGLHAVVPVLEHNIDYYQTTSQRAREKIDWTSR